MAKNNGYNMREKMKTYTRNKTELIKITKWIGNTGQNSHSSKKRSVYL
jgi:hypothetical protein